MAWLIPILATLGLLFFVGVLAVTVVCIVDLAICSSKAKQLRNAQYPPGPF